MNYYFHIASAGERWDTIAHKYYGNCHNIAPIIMANPHIPVTPVIEEGIEVKVPIPDKANNNKKSSLPIWKQG